MDATPTPLARSWNAWLANDPQPPGPGWLQWVWTLLFCAGLALFFTLLAGAFHLATKGNLGAPAAWVRVYLLNLVVSLTIGLLIHLMFALFMPWIGRARIRAWPMGRRTAFFSGTAMLGTAVGWPLGLWLAGQDVLRWLPWDDPIRLAGLLVPMAGIAGIITLVLHAKAREIEAAHQATEAQLKLLQGQMEPHFLFNTLANVESLIETDAPKARRMLEAFTDYLRSSLTHLRSPHTTLGLELDLATAYLHLMQERMGPRLRFSVEANDALRALPLPALMLQPLLENAVHHGLEALVEGGEITLRAWQQGQALRIEVHDTGRGLNAPKRPGGHRGAGLTLDNLRQRLQGYYGEQGRLELSAAEPGTRAVLHLPLTCH